jgi:hypothetical protein
MKHCTICGHQAEQNGQLQCDCGQERADTDQCKNCPDVHTLKETIKGLDRATVEYTSIIAEKDERIVQLENSEFISIQYIKTLEKSNKGRLDRIAQLEEANASLGECKQITKEEWKENFK